MLSRKCLKSYRNSEWVVPTYNLHNIIFKIPSLKSLTWVSNSLKFKFPVKMWEMLIPLLDQLEWGLKLKGARTRSTGSINQYLHTGSRIPIIIFWKGTTNKDIIARLQYIKKMLKITSYSDNKDNYFNLKLLDTADSSNKLIYSSQIGHHPKKR